MDIVSVLMTCQYQDCMTDRDSSEYAVVHGGHRDPIRRGEQVHRGVTQVLWHSRHKPSPLGGGGVVVQPDYVAVKKFFQHDVGVYC